MDFKRTPWRNVLLVVIELFVICNIVFLDLWIFKNLQNQPAPKAITTSNIPDQKSPISGIAGTVSSPSSAVIPALTQAPTIIYQQTAPSTPSVKEFFIPFGTGTGSFEDWQTVPGALATIDNSSYPNIKSVTFEASIHNLGSDQIVYLRLFDITDNHAIYNSDITFSNKGEQFGTSQSFALDGGSKQYQVQLKTQLQSPVSLDMSRIHILLN